MALFRSVATVGSLTLVSRAFGFVRDILTAAILGAGPVADAFFVAQRLPNLFRSLFAEGAFSAAFVPRDPAFDQEPRDRHAGRQLEVGVSAVHRFTDIIDGQPKHFLQLPVAWLRLATV